MCQLASYKISCSKNLPLITIFIELFRFHKIQRDNILFLGIAFYILKSGFRMAKEPLTSIKISTPLAAALVLA